MRYATSTRVIVVEILRRKLDAPPKAVGSGSVTPPSMAQFRQEARTTQPSSGGKTTIIRQGSTEDDYGGAGSRDEVGDPRTTNETRPHPAAKPP